MRNERLALGETHLARTPQAAEPTPPSLSERVGADLVNRFNVTMGPSLRRALGRRILTRAGIRTPLGRR